MVKNKPMVFSTGFRNPPTRQLKVQVQDAIRQVPFRGQALRSCRWDRAGDELKVSGYIWDVTSATKRERFRHLEQGRPASWTSFVYGDLVKADKLL